MNRNLCIISGIIASIAFTAAPVVNAAGGVTLDPSVVRLTMQPGEVWRGQVRVTNDADEAVTFVTQTANLVGDAEQETVAVGEDVVARLGTLAAWLKPGAETVRLDAGAAGLLYFSVQVPDNAAPGLHRGLLILSRAPDTSGRGTGLGTTAAVALGVELTVVGQPNHHIQFGAIVVSPRIGTKPPVTVLASVLNTGNTLPTMDVTAKVDRFWGADDSVHLEPDSGTAKVAPGSMALFRGSWSGDGRFPAGLFRIRLTAKDSSGVFETTRWVLLVPWQALLGLLSALVVVVFGRRRAILRLRRRRS